MIADFFNYEILQRAFFACILTSIVCGIIGVIIVEKRLVMMSGGIAHTSYGGVGLGFWLGFPPIIGAFVFAVLAAFGIGVIKRKKASGSDIAVGLFWSLGMALGIVFVTLTKSYPPEITTYLFGNIISVTLSDLILILAVALLVLFVVFSLYNNIKAYLFDEEFAFIIGLKTTFLDFLVLVLIALSIVALIRIAGIILVMALLTAPAAAASYFTDSLTGRMIYSSLLGIIFCISGLVISYMLDISAGAVIVIIAVLFYLAVFAVNNLYKRFFRAKAAAGRD